MYKKRGTTATELNQVKFTRQMATAESVDYILNITKFSADGRFRKCIENAIERAPKGRMAGRDGVFVEMMRLRRKSFAELLAVVT